MTKIVKVTPHEAARMVIATPVVEVAQVIITLRLAPVSTPALLVFTATPVVNTPPPDSAKVYFSTGDNF